MSGDLTFNKYAAALLATALGFMLIKEVSHLAMHVEKPETPAYALEIPDTSTKATEELDLPFPQATFVDAMDATKGAKVFKKCTSCHNVEKGGKNGTGPNIWDIVGKASGQKAGFNGYSGELKASGITWGYEELDAFLTKPKKYLSGTKMNFVGLKKEADRAAVIEYLRVASDAPVDRPAPAAAPMQETAEGVVPIAGTAEEKDAGVKVVEEMVQEKAPEKAADVMTEMKATVEKTAEAATEAPKAVVSDVVETVTDNAEQMADKATDAPAEAVAETVTETISENVGEVMEKPEVSTEMVDTGKMVETGTDAAGEITDVVDGAKEMVPETDVTTDDIIEKGKDLVEGDKE